MRIGICCFFLLLISQPILAQVDEPLVNDSLLAEKDILDVIFKKRRDSTEQVKLEEEKKVYFSLMPLSSGSGGPNIAISVVNASFRMGDKETTKFSNVTLYPSTNLSTYFHLKVIPNLWLADNNWNIPGKLEIAQEAQDNFGLGGDTSEDSLFVIHYSVSKAIVSFNKRLVNHVYLGAGYALDYYYHLREVSDEWRQTDFDRHGYGTDATSVSSGLSINMLIDSRVNPINPLEGFFTNLILRVNPIWMGSDELWYALYLDTRKYINLSKEKHRVLAFWGLYWATWGDVPYLNLPASGLDFLGSSGRGYSRARYRGQQMLYTEVEFRFDLTQNGLLGGVVFTNCQSIMEEDSREFKYLNPAIGTGLRLKFNKFSDSNLTFDIGYGDGFNWYLGLNEYF
ncbi:BamA/TamA family outer membrane protein [Reichenbachiella agarivorans]|uniref:BamA/TamA family outer membrane protein n=1 Tax=Reichenbachiella agarivorans TaxID=2979464 RepID=A0ABY6CU40_9BACT|nr:BamA/TamA family outer membrane protein [Reichenbachiella agarivorans]UXP34042.1 BamA/TamA family outer membrane protein [Reichenbachiella agarivorans]